MATTRTSRVLGVLLMLGAAFIMFLGDNGPNWIRSSGGIFYLGVFGVVLLVFADYTSKGTVTGRQLVLVAATMVLLAVAWLLGLPLVVGSIIMLSFALMRFLMERVSAH